jgi:hypothetical protein
MLTESDVIEGVCRFLEAKHFYIKQRLTEDQKGRDIIAIAPDSKTQVAIEAKGETSSRKDSKRFGQPFDGNQAYDHVAKAFYCASIYSAESLLGGIAVPKNAAHEKQVSAIIHALRQLCIEVFWVLPDGSVEVAGHWPLWNGNAVAA